MLLVSEWYVGGYEQVSGMLVGKKQEEGSADIYLLPRKERPTSLIPHSPTTFTHVAPPGA